jgi:hypothetical protein
MVFIGFSACEPDRLRLVTAVIETDMSTTVDKTTPATSPSTESTDFVTDKGPSPRIAECDVGSSSLRPLTPPENKAQVWQPGFGKQFPWLAFTCLCTVVVSSVAAILVLVFSNGKAESQWPKKIAPNVLLSVLMSISSIAITLAVGQGIAIAWWRRAMKGATFEDLHNSWEFGTSLKSIFLKLRYFNTIALAALVTKLAIIDGILFQRSTTTYIALGPQRTVNITYYPTETFPDTGRFANNGTIRSLDYDYTFDVANWLDSNEGSISSTVGFSDCEGVCFTKVPMLGFTFDCTETTEQVDYIRDAKNNPNKTVNTNVELFRVNFTRHFASDERNYTWVELNIVTYQGENNTDPTLHMCPATLTRQNCVLRPALLKYPVVMQYINGTTSQRDVRNEKTQVMLGQLDPKTQIYIGMSDYIPGQNQLPEFELVKYIDLPRRNIAYNLPTSIGGLVYTLQKNFDSQTYLTANSTDWDLTYTSLFANTQTSTDDTVVNPTLDTWGCPINQGYDTLNAIMQSINTLSFIVSDDAYNRNNFTDTNEFWNSSWAYTSATQHKDEVHYRSHYPFMFGALASTLVCVILILPSYWGYWHLGRQVTLGPLEIANAFQALALANIPAGNGHAQAVVQAVGNQKVKYTEFESDGRAKEYRFDHSA